MVSVFQFIEDHEFEVSHVFSSNGLLLIPLHVHNWNLKRIRLVISLKNTSEPR